MHTNGVPRHASHPSRDLQLLTVVDAARYLAIGRSALYHLLGTGQLESVHIGRSRRVPLGELERFVRERLST